MRSNPILFYFILFYKEQAYDILNNKDLPKLIHYIKVNFQTFLH